MKAQAIIVLSLATVLWVSCKNEPKTVATANTSTTTETPAETKVDVADGTYAVNTANSVIEWVGTKANGSQHAGIIKLQNGELNLFQGNITGGKVTIDMNSITVTDLEGDKKTDLEDHLKNADFFEVGKFPTGSFEFGSTLPLTDDASGAKHVAAGSLTLKGISKAIRIPFNMRSEAGKVIVETPEFGINRVEWDIKYNSGFIGTIKEKIIDDFIKLKIRLETEAPAQ